MTVSSSRARYQLSVALGWVSALMAACSLVIITSAALRSAPAPVAAPAPSTIEGRAND